MMGTDSIEKMRIMKVIRMMPRGNIMLETWLMMVKVQWEEEGRGSTIGKGGDLRQFC